MDNPNTTFESAKQAMADDYARMWNLLRRVYETALLDRHIYEANEPLFDEIIELFMDDSEGE